MEIRIQNISDRLQCITEDTTPLELTQLGALEVIGHLMWVDACVGGKRMTAEQIDRCRQRIINFANEN